MTANKDIKLPIDLESASVFELRSALPKIGESKANKIVELREEEGGLTMQKLVQVTGVTC